MIATIAILGQLGTSWLRFSSTSNCRPGRHNVVQRLLVQTPDGQVMRVFFLLASILVCLIARVSLAKQRLPRVEFYHIVLVASGAMMLLAQSESFRDALRRARDADDRPLYSRQLFPRKTRSRSKRD